MQLINPQIEESWKQALRDEFDAPYFNALTEFLREEKKKHIIYPPGPQIFSAFNHTPFNRVKVVIIGQDPYHGPGQAHGLCFSVPDGVPHPPSLVNIFKEIESDLGIPILTVRANEPASHQNKGWETFTNAVIRNLNDKRKNLVFLLWGNYAQAKESLIDSSRHYILKAAHPSPLSAYRGFFGCRHFSRTNQILAEQGLNEIDWSLE
jgi:uracil-DNA glycosylase